MKRIYIIVLSALLACLLVLPVSASDDTYTYTLSGSIVFSEEISFDLYDGISGVDTKVPFLSNGLNVTQLHVNSINSTISYWVDGQGYIVVYSNGIWVDDAYRFLDFGSGQTVDYPNDYFPLWLSENSSYIYPILDECDGSSCPATDADHNNICDDCGLVLSYSLRSSLLDFAKTTAQGWAPDYSYFAVVESLNDSSYVVYISETPMYANPPDYDTALGSSMRWFSVSENEDGSFSHSGNASISSWSGTLIYANHDIENFQTPPLAVVIQGVTGEALEVELPNLMTEVRTIVVLAVGCLALLILLVVLVRALRNFSRS